MPTFVNGTNVTRNITYSVVGIHTYRHVQTTTSLSTNFVIIKLHTQIQNPEERQNRQSANVFLTQDSAFITVVLAIHLVVIVAIFLALSVQIGT